jgi:hypothetical protein
MTELLTAVLLAAAAVPAWLLARVTYRLYTAQR